MKNKFKRFFAGLLVGTLISGYALGKDSQKTVKPADFSPKITIDARDPRTDTQANTNLKNTGVSLTGEALEHLSQKYLSDTKINRGVEALANLGIIAHLNVLSHEYGHFRTGEQEGAVGGKVDFNLFGRSSYVFDSLKNDNLDSRLKIAVAGLNQNSLNAVDNFKRAQLEDTKYFNDLDKLFSRLHLLQYFNRGCSDPLDDHTQMIDILNKKGYGVSGREFRQNSLLITLLSPDNWQSVSNVGNFVWNGKRTFSPKYMKIGKGVELSMPSLTHCFTENGDYVNVTEFLRHKGRTIEFNFAHDLDFTHEDAGVNKMSFGAKLYDLNLGDRTELKPYASIDVKRSDLDIDGFNIGVDIEQRINDSLSLRATFEYNDNSLLSGVNGRGNGSYATVGLARQF